MRIKAVLNINIAWILLIATVLAVPLIYNAKSSAACTIPAQNFGIATSSTSVPEAGRYRVFVRLMAPDTNSNSVLLDIDGGDCFTVGNNSTAIPANAWTWVNYHSGNQSSFMDVDLTAGQHSIRIIGQEAGVKVDRVILTTDLGCPVTSTGDACATPPDTTPPTVVITSPSENALVSGTVNVNATATDDVGGSNIASVEFRAGANVIGTDTSAPYSAQLNTANLPGGQNTVVATARDVAGNTASDSVTITVQNSGTQDTEPPSVPTNITPSATAHNRVSITWTASTDNVGVVGYIVYRDGTQLAEVTAGTSYVDSTVAANSVNTYKIAAFDAARNYTYSSYTPTIPATTPSPPDTQAPTAPPSLSATLVGSSQANLSWTASTDNVGVREYEVYRATGTAAAVRIATVPSTAATSYGDTGLAASTTFRYHVIAKDAIGNSSPASPQATVTTPALPPPPSTTGAISGVVSSSSGGTVSGAVVSIFVNGSKRSYSANSSGAYTIPNLPPGTHSVKYTAKGYVSQSLSVGVTSGSSTVSNITLQKR